MAETISTTNDEEESKFLGTAKSLSTQEKNIDIGSKRFYAKRSKRNNMFGSWQQCQLLEEIDNIDNSNDPTYIVKFISDGQKKYVASYELAKLIRPQHNNLKKGKRVIAKRRSEELPYELDETGQRIGLFASNDEEFYPGMVAGESSNGYLIFFDDGMVQYIPMYHVFCVQDDNGRKHAHLNARDYFEFFVKNRKWVILPKVNQKIEVELDGVWKNAEVKQINDSLALIQFIDARRFEWIYLGSPRISEVYRKYMKVKAFDGFVEFKTYKACLSAANDVVIIDSIEPSDDLEPEQSIDAQSTHSMNGIQQKIHTCSPDCVRFNDQKDERRNNLESYSALQRPLMTGWVRLANPKVHYQAPCGVELHAYNDIDEYLVNTDSKLRIDCFNLNKTVKIPNISTEIMAQNDISRGIEKIPIPVRGQQISLDFDYITGYNFEYIDTEPENSLHRTGCGCMDNCRDKTKCSCWRLSIQHFTQKALREHEYKRYANKGYSHMRLLGSQKISTGIVECGSECKCSKEKCVNRVVQNGLQHQLELFMTKRKGWGVRTKIDLPKATFVCRYAGDVLEESDADKRDRKYQFKLPKSSMDEDAVYSESDIDSDDEPLSKVSHLQTHDVHQPFLNFFPANHENGNANNFPDSDYFESHEEKTIIIDALTHGNVSRYINHSCDPNMVDQIVFVDNDMRFPVIAFFTHRIVKADEELTIDYNYDQDNDKETPCHCGANNCRKRLI